MADLFEYKIVVSEDDDETDETTLNAHGAEGWELVNAVADVRATEDAGEGDDEMEDSVPVTVFYFKRRRG